LTPSRENTPQDDGPYPGSVWKRNLSRIDLLVPQGHPRLNELKALGYGIHEYNRRGHPNHHAVSAAFRRHASVLAINRLYQAGCRNVLSVYGAQRDIDIVKFLNKSPKKGHPDEVDPMKITVFHPIVTATDVGREVDARDTSDTIGGFDGYLFVNVYKAEDREITPEYLASLHAPIAIVHHRFDGWCGTIEGEGAWIRVENVIFQRPDKYSDAYGPHPDLQFLSVDSSSHGISWATPDHVGTSYVTIVKPVQTTIDGKISRAPTNGWYELPLPEIPRWIPSSGVSMVATLMKWPIIGDILTTCFPRKRIMVDVAMMQHFRRWIVGRNRTGYGLKQLAQEMQAYTKEDKDAQLLDQLFPDFYPSFSEDMVWAVFLEDIERKATTARAARVAYGSTLVEYNENVQNIASNYSSDGLTPKKLGMLCLFLALGWYAWRNRHGRTRANMFRPGLVNTREVRRLEERLRAARHILDTSNCELARAAAAKEIHDLTSSGLVKTISCLYDWWRSWLQFGFRVKTTLFQQCARLWRSASQRVQVSAWVQPVRQLSPLALATGVLSGIHQAIDYVASGAAELVIRGRDFFRRLPDQFFPAHEWREIMEGTRTPSGALRYGLTAGFTSSLLIGAGATAFVIARLFYAGRRVLGVAAWVFFEEWLKSLNPDVGFLIWTYEVLGAWFTNGNVRGQLVASTLCHILVPIYFPQPIPLIFHLWWNWSALLGLVVAVPASVVEIFRRASPPNWNVWRQFREDYYVVPWPARPTASPDLIGAFPMHEDDVFLPRQTFPYTSPNPRDETLIVSGHLIPEIEPLDRKYLAIWPLSTPGYVPARSDANLICVLETRVLACPPMDPVEQRANWKTTRVFLRRTWPRLLWEEHCQEWLDHLDSPLQLTRARKAVERLEQGTWSPRHPALRRVKLFVKTDEMLVKAGLKPRPIANVDPDVQAIVGPYIYAATRNLQEEWPFDFSNPFRVGNWTVHLTYGAKCTDDALSQWMRRALDMPAGSIAIIVAGDDSLVVVRHHDYSLTIWEGDASMYDQSESWGPLLNEYKALRQLGCPSYVTKILLKVASATYVAESRDGLNKVKVKRHARPFRDTGGGDTSFGNSWVMGSAWGDVVATLRDTPWSIVNLQAAFARLGLDMKMRMHTTPYRATFLKGIWYPTISGPVWGPLPSRVLKFGKSLVDPRTLYCTRNLKAAAEAFINDVSVGYSAFLQVPCLRAMVARGMQFSALPRRPRARMRPLFYGVEASFSAREAKVTDLSYIAAHYDVEPEIFQEFERLIAKAPVFTFLAHPLASRLARVDYG